MNRFHRNEAPDDIESKLITSLETARVQCAKLTKEPCRLQTREITIDCEGAVHLCCALYNPALSRIGKYLDLHLLQIQAAKFASDTCSDCMKCGGHAYATMLRSPKVKWRNRVVTFLLGLIH